MEENNSSVVDYTQLLQEIKVELQNLNQTLINNNAYWVERAEAADLAAAEAQAVAEAEAEAQRLADLEQVADLEAAEQIDYQALYLETLNNIDSSINSFASSSDSYQSNISERVENINYDLDTNFCLGVLSLSCLGVIIGVGLARLAFRKV